MDIPRRITTYVVIIASTCLHYGQEAFEGMKAFRGKDGKIRLFRCEENAKRMLSSAEYVMMQAPSIELFEEAVVKAIELNKEYVPPYESGASLYIRPLLIGVGPQMGVAPAKEYIFVVFVAPVGPYFKAGFKPTKVMLERRYDRAAPNGTGHIKVGGNYAAGMRSGEVAHQKGYSTAIFLDSKEKKYIDECGPANFFGIKNGSYITPFSHQRQPDGIGRRYGIESRTPAYSRRRTRDFRRSRSLRYGCCHQSYRTDR